jgi:hypothetical protein
MPASNTDKFRKVVARWSGQIGSAGVASAVATTVPLQSTTGLPTDTAVNLTINRYDITGTTKQALWETITGVVSGSNIINCLRGQEGTASSWSAGTLVEFLITADNTNDMVDGILAEHNQDGTHNTTYVVTPTGTQTLTNKTLTTPTIASFTNATHNHTNAAGGGTIGESALSLSDNTTNDVSTTKHGFVPKAPNDTAQFLRGDGSWAAPSSGSVWVQDTNTWTRTGNHTYTISGDQTATLKPGTLVRYKDGGSFEFGVVKSSSYGAPNTTVNLAVNSDYAMAATTITDTYYSYGHPPDFPSTFSFDAAPTGFSGSPTSATFFSTNGRTCFLWFDISGTSNATTLTFTNPFDRTGKQYLYQATGYAQNNSVVGTLPAQMEIQSNTTINVYKDLAQAAWTSSGTKRIIGGITFDF